MSKPKLLRAQAALQIYLRTASISVSAIIFSLLAPAPLIENVFYKLRKEGEQTFSQYDENLNPDVINFSTFDDLTIYSFMTDITILTVAIIADKIKIPKLISLY